MREPVASLSWNLFVDCPHCNESIDLADSPHDDEGYFSVPLFGNKWEEIPGKNVDCPVCQKTFAVGDVEY